MANICSFRFFLFFVIVNNDMLTIFLLWVFYNIQYIALIEKEPQFLILHQDIHSSYLFRSSLLFVIVYFLVYFKEIFHEFLKKIREGRLPWCRCVKKIERRVWRKENDGDGDKRQDIKKTKVEVDGLCWRKTERKIIVGGRCVPLRLMEKTCQETSTSRRQKERISIERL